MYVLQRLLFCHLSCLLPVSVIIVTSHRCSTEEEVDADVDPGTAMPSVRCLSSNDSNCRASAFSVVTSSVKLVAIRPASALASIAALVSASAARTNASAAAAELLPIDACFRT